MTKPRYQIVETIGRGGMGEVCLADDLMLHRQVALKFVTSAGASDVLEQLLGEARAAASLDHPFICSIYEVTTLDGRPCIAMEFVRGETLERCLRRGPLAVPDALHVAEEIAEALEAAHRRRVIHRDLKPANVMLTEDRHIKVMDFGLALRLPIDGADDGLAGTTAPADVGVLRGTPAYMAPEQIRGEAADRRSDIFAFGILLYELLSGVNPFRRASIDATLAAILDEPVAHLHDQAPAVSPIVGDVVARLLTRNSADRYQSFGDVRMDLRRLAADLVVSSGRATLPVVERASGASDALVGRAAERALLLQSMTEAGSGCGTVVVLSGEAGTGKTYLAQDVLTAARRLGVQALVGRCYEQDGAPPLSPYIEVLEDALRLMPGDVFRRAMAPSAPELVKLLPSLRRLFPDMEAPLDLPPQLRQRFLFTNIREFLTRCARVHPLVIFIDDVQWADEPTLQLTQHLAQHSATLPLMVMAAYRDVEVATTLTKSGFHSLLDRVRGQRRGALAPRAIKAALDDLVRQGQARGIALRPFGEAEVRGLLAVLGRADPPAPLVRRFVDQTGGSPLFVAELFRHLKDERRLFDARNTWRRDLEFSAGDVPDSLRVVLERRLERLSDQARRVLTAAAVIGRHFELELLEAVADVDDAALVAALDEAEQLRLLSGPAGRREVMWRFPHELIRQALIGTMSQLRRQRLHMRIADAMVRLDTPARAYASGIAHHLYSAGHIADAERTAQALTRAGDAAYALYATEDAIVHYRRALEVLRDAGGAEATRRRVEERLADLQALSGDRAAATAHYQELTGAYQATGERVDQARMARKLGALHWQGGDRGRAMEYYERALADLEGAAAHIEAAHLYQELGLAAFRTGENQKAIDWAERALRSAEAALVDGSSAPELRKAVSAAVAHATNTIGVALARLGQLDAARQHIERSLEVAREQQLLDVACRAYANLGVLYSSVEPRRAIEVSLTGLELASKIGAASLQPYIYANLAAAYCALTDRCESEGLDAAQAAASLDRELGQLDHLAVPLIVMAQIHQCQGELQKAQDAYREALALAETIGEPQLILPCYDGLATIHLDRGDRARAAEYLEKSQQLCQRTGLDPDTLLLLPFLS
ncbi:MAG: serine/threonine-protein kinase PknK [Vicinamibacterales bacterium]